MKMCRYHVEFFEKLLVMSIKWTKTLPENYIKKSLLQVVVDSELHAQNIVIYPHSIHWDPLYIYTCLCG
jgi:hypothetical protein